VYQKGLDSYRQTQVTSRTPLELVVMLYDGVLGHLSVARDAIERKDIGARRDAMSRALAILGELQNTLNVEHGGEIAAALDDLYSYATRRLMQAVVDNDVEPVDEVRRLLDGLRDSWRTIATQQV
jgi:flagellar secretion chaperone FliS